MYNEAHSKSKRRMPSYTKMFDYWGLRCLKCDCDWRGCISRDEHRLYETYIDTGEPECVRCERFLGYAPAVVRREPECAVEAAQCVKAHIVPRWRGGADDVDNVAPLCDPCHKIDPEPATRREWLDWACNERTRRDIAMRALRAAPPSILRDDAALLLMQSTKFGLMNIPDHVVKLMGLWDAYVAEQESEVPQ